MMLARGRSSQPVGRARTGEDQHVLRPDGRRLSFAEYGDPDGLPVFGFHGTPGSRFMFRLVDGPAQRAGLRIIAPERPGFGRSTFQASRSLTDWPDDVSAVANALGIGPFAVAGISGGGPYAVACAALLPERVTAVGLISPMGPLRPPEGLDRDPRAERVLFRLAPYLGPAVRGAMLLGRAMFLRAPNTTYKLLLRRAGPADRKVLANPRVRENMLAGVGEGLRPGIRGTLAETRLFARPWSLPFQAIRAPVLMWQGMEDRNVSVAASLRLAELIRTASLKRIEGAGHYWIFDHIEEVLAAIKQAMLNNAPPPRPAHRVG